MKVRITQCFFSFFVSTVCFCQYVIVTYRNGTILLKRLAVITLKNHSKTIPKFNPLKNLVFKMASNELQVSGQVLIGV